MDFALTDDHELFRRTVREFARGVLTPAARAADESGAFAPEIWRETAAVGLFGLLVPEAHGGAGVDTLGFVLALEEVARECAAMASALIGHHALACAPLVLAGSVEQQARWLPALASGATLGAGALAQPDATNLRAQPLADTGGWQLDGHVSGVTNAGPSAVYVVWTAPDPAGGALGAYVLESGTPGLQVGPPLERVGARGAVVADLEFAACHVAADEALGAPDGAAAVAQHARDLARIGVAAESLGIAQAALDAALAYAREREQFGRPIADFQGLRWMLADLHLAIESARLLTYRAAWLRDQGQPFGPAAAMAQLHAAQAATHAATKAVQVHGGYGYMRESVVQRYFRDAHVVGTDYGPFGSQRTEIAATLLPAPR
jgi:butyryl-CoA dehydrogenase